MVVEQHGATGQQVGNEGAGSGGTAMASTGTDQVPVMRSQHAFFVVGTEVLFLVHMLNSWIDCHRYQVVLRVTLPEHVRRKILSDRERHPDEWHIIGNISQELISLPDIHRGVCRSYHAQVWRGWPKQPGTEHWPWANDKPVFPERFPVTVDRVVYFRRLDFNLDYPRTPGYVLFGEGDEAHINHCAIKQPDYDHVATLAHAPEWLPSSLLEAGVPVNFPTIPSVPGGDACREALHESNPVGVGGHHVQYAGLGPRRRIAIEREVFFGTWPFNRSNLAAGQPWNPCGIACDEGETKTVATHNHVVGA